MKRVSVALLAGSALFIAVWGAAAQRAAADDQTANVEIKIQAPLDAVDCTANTISVLGLTIDISAATIDAEGANGSGDQGGDDGGDTGGTATPTPTEQSGCAALVTNQTVEVRLASDAAPLSAIEVGQSGDDGVQIQAPVQSVDATNQQITVLGLVVSVGNAQVNGDDDQGNDSGATVDLTQLTAGQSVEMQLDSSQLPNLVATELHVRNFTNQVEVEVDDSTGTQVDDTDANGNPTDDVEADVTETVPVQNATGAAGPRRIKTTVHLRRNSNGSFTLTGLPTGRAKIVVTRTNANGTTTGKRSVPVHSNSTRHVKIRLRTPK